MNFKMSLSSARCCAVAALVLIGFGWRTVQADGVDPNIDYTAAMCGLLTQPQQPRITYGAKPTQDLSMPSVEIGVKTPSGNVFWSLDGSPVPTNGCTGDMKSETCGPSMPNTNMDPVFQIIAPPDNGTTGVSPTDTAGRVQIRNVMGRMLTTGDIGREGSFAVTVSSAPSGSPSCSWQYTVHVVQPDPIGGWGDPHMTTVDGVHYDFQGAGEYTALRKDKFEIQTRQRPVPTAGVGGANEHTGLATCVSIYSGVALRIGSNQVSLVPNLSGQPDPSGLQLRVNHKQVTLTDSGIDLRAGGGNDSKAELEGRIVKAAGGAYEFDAADGTQVVATPAYWNDQQTWYLNLNVYQASATKGIWGLIPSGSWLPALPDGSSVGQMPRPLDQRYQTLYTTFGNAWRVTDVMSLFDYAPGTNTATFTRAEWPRFNPESCAIEGQTAVQPTTPEVAAQACSAITNDAQKADCIFDVTVTGETGFAQTYGTMQGFRPHGTGWQPTLAGVGPQPTPRWPWWLWILILILGLIIIAVLIARKMRTA
jgi:hypothetical protein